MRIADTYCALMVLRGDIRATPHERLEAAEWLRDQDILPRLPGDVQRDAEAIIKQRDASRTLAALIGPMGRLNAEVI